MTDSSSRLFIVSRSDLPPGAIAAQSVHAALTFAHEHPFEWRTWYLGSNNIVLLSARDESDLLRLAERAREAGVSFAVFREPDFPASGGIPLKAGQNGSMTGIAIAPAGWRLVSSLPLALRQPACSAKSGEAA